jgi:hypothetical protein
MRANHLRRNIAIGAAAATAVAGGGIAVATTTSTTRSDERTAYLNDVAQRLNVTPDKLTEALKGAYFDRLDAAVTAGRLTQAQADAAKKRVTDGAPVPFGPGGGPGGPGPGPGGPGMGKHGRGGPLGGGPALDAAATFLGMSAADVRKALRSGKTLAALATDKGKTEDDLVAALVTAEKAQLDKAVTAQRLTAAQRDKIEADLPARLKAFVEGKRPAGGPPGAGPGAPKEAFRRHGAPGAAPRGGPRPAPPAGAAF